jgi:osmoprotectant transport system substrate-binding protein
MIARPARRATFPWLLLVLAAVVVPLAAGCGSGGAAAGNGAAAEGDEARIAEDQFRLSGTQRDAQFAVGSEGFTEQEILGSITIQALEAAGATVIDRTGLGGNEEVREALLSGEIDLYWEYTATGWLVFLNETRSISDPQELYQAVAEQDLEENGVRWLEPAPGNDTYAIAQSEETQQRLGVETISDLGRLVEERPEEATLCLNNDDDFRTRFDGLPGLQRAYGFRFPEDNLIEMSLEAVYGAVEEGEICNFGVAFTTSGFIREHNLQLLEDDKDFFAVYNPSLTMQRETLENYPQIREIFAPISRKLDTETLRRLNYAVDVEGETPEAVAEQWLRENGFVE